MNYDQLLSSLKIDLGIMSTAYDSRLTQYLKSAEKEIEREGINLSADSVDDQDIVIRYAAWMWRMRDKEAGMPRMLRWQLNNRLFEEKAETGEGA